MTVHRLGVRARVDDIDRRIIALLEEDARRSYGSIGRQVFLSASAVKRRVDALRRSRALLGFTALVEAGDADAGAEAMVSMSIRKGVGRDAFVAALAGHPEVDRAWMVSGDADVIAHVGAADAETLERSIDALRRDPFIERLHTEHVARPTVCVVESREGEAV